MCTVHLVQLFARAGRCRLACALGELGWVTRLWPADTRLQHDRAACAVPGSLVAKTLAVRGQHTCALGELGWMPRLWQADSKGTHREGCSASAGTELLRQSLSMEMRTHLRLEQAALGDGAVAS